MERDTVTPQHPLATQKLKRTKSQRSMNTTARHSLLMLHLATMASLDRRTRWWLGLYRRSPADRQAVGEARGGEDRIDGGSSLLVGVGVADFDAPQSQRHTAQPHKDCVHARGKIARGDIGRANERAQADASAHSCSHK
jgi:hypothetical protein